MGAADYLAGAFGPGFYLNLFQECRSIATHLAQAAASEILGLAVPTPLNPSHVLGTGPRDEGIKNGAAPGRVPGAAERRNVQNDWLAPDLICMFPNGSGETTDGPIRS